MRSNPIKLLLLVLVLVAACFQTATATQVDDPYQKPEMVAEIKHLRDVLFDGKYEETLALCRKNRQKYPDLLVWHFAAMLVPQARMLEMHDWDLSKTYWAEWEGLLKLADEIKTRRPFSAYDYLCMGGGYGVVGLHYVRGRKYKDAFSVGVKALGVLKNALKVDPQCNDAYLGFGIYHYLRGMLSTRFKWLPFFADDKQVGLRELDKARKGLFARPLADLAQVYLYKEEGKWKEGLELAQRLQKEYPHGLLLPQTIGVFQVSLGQNEPALANADLVLKSDPKNGPVHLLRGIALYYLGRLDESEKECQACINLGATYEYQAPAYHFLGEIAWKRGRYQDARTNWKKAASLDPEYKEPEKALKRPIPGQKAK